MFEILAHGESQSWFPLVWPPAHPLLVNFTAALVPVSFLADLAGRWLGRASLRATGYWTLLAAAAVTPFTALAGWLWLRDMEGMSMAQLPVHKWLGTALAAVLIVLAIWRVRIERRQQPPGAAYLLSMTVLVLALIVQGHLGATMSFTSADSESSEPAESQHDAAPHDTAPHDKPATKESHQHGDRHDSAKPAKPPGATTAPAPATAPILEPVQYTCTMHPEIVSDVPGKCPKCKMNLVRKK